MAARLGNVPHVGRGSAGYPREKGIDQAPDGNDEDEDLGGRPPARAGLEDAEVLE